MVSQKYRWDFIGLSTDTKPTPETSEKVVNGSTFYCSDTSKLYVYCDGTWYERKPLGGGGGGGSYVAGNGIDITDDTISVDTTTIQPKLTAGSNVTISDDTISATDTTYSNFVGTDGQTAGTAGLVPAPATTDAGKFLKADGTWGTAGGSGGGMREVTSADFNWPTANPDGVATWLLSDGVYYSKATKLYFNTSTNVTGNRSFIKSTTGNGSLLTASFYGNSAGNNVNVYLTNTNGSEAWVNTIASLADIYSDPTTKRKVQIGEGSSASSTPSIAIGRYATASSSNAVAIGPGASTANSARATAANTIALGNGSHATQQGQMDIGMSTGNGYNSSTYRLLTGLYDPQTAHDAATKGYVDPTTDSSAPTTATVGRLGQIYIDTTNADAYMCVAVDTVTPSYTWKKITA